MRFEKKYLGVGVISEIGGRKVEGKSADILIMIYFTHLVDPYTQLYNDGNQNSVYLSLIKVIDDNDS